MAKGYRIGRVDVADAVPFAKCGARFVVRAGRGEPKEGALRSRRIVIEFADHATALACRQSEEYARARALREAVSLGDLVVVEGDDGPQPG